MELSFLKDQYKSHQHYEPISKLLQGNSNFRIGLKNLLGSSKSVFFSNLVKESNQFHIFILPDKEEAAYLFSDLTTLLEEDSFLFFPSSYKRSIQYQQIDESNLILRSNVLNQLNSLRDKEDKKQRLKGIVTYPEGLIEKVVTHAELKDNTLILKKGEKISIDFIQEVLTEYGFEYTDFVYDPGQFAVRGGIVDVFSFADDHPYRIDFFGDEVESIRSFNVESQLSIDKFDEISIMPKLETASLMQNTESIISFSPQSSVIWSNNIDFVADRLMQVYNETDFNQSDISKDEKLLNKYEWLEELNGKSSIEFGSSFYFKTQQTFEFDTKHQPVFKKNFTLLGDNLKMHLAKEYNTIITSDSEKQIKRLHAIFEDTHQGIQFDSIIPALHEGFIDESLKICCYTDHQIFDRYHKYKINTYFSSKASISLRELKDLHPGDYVVHIDHGIGRFGGLEKVEVNGQIQEKIKLVYRDNDTVFVGIHSLHRISKYKGKDNSEPKIYKLGSGAWQKLKTNTKKKVKDIAKDLIALYAKRKSEKGFSFTKDTYLQEELEASFIYEDTPDQEKATSMVKKDMENEVPMDRLVCGDVGFGKTEIAVRAAFKAVSDSKQVAILVPTTILALQHYNTFKERLKDFPCNVAYISRLKRAGEQKKILAEVKEGNVDILVGTHRLLGKDIDFKDLGLFIIDEEQKFGVAAKEKLKALRVNVDTLTLTATPIPRTLQFSLLGARDLSIINTPPPNRHPIITEVHTFDEKIIAEGINFELSRGGQVFFINNRVQNIFEIEALIKKVCPQAKTLVGHGQMDGPKLEKIMVDFINGDYDVLIATTIIESGLDIPNANTIFINNAQNFGLSDLHQLRGRVGRSNKRAFCYLLSPPLTMVTPEARRRLKAIEEYSDLGSGFHIAMQDLDIRGAGNMLGAEQSGFISDIGYETYNRILEEAVLELKEEEFKDLFKDDEKNAQSDEPKRYVLDCIIDTDEEIHLPNEYVSNISERVRLYRKLDNIAEKEKLEIFRSELIDRFGPLPQATEKLL
ncbi:MAG: transcription-repair coupling factor, partial [Bacteroidales bacterium]|nr:transcription-repair coupling factor [Bacteroidales bacterium]